MSAWYRNSTILAFVAAIAVPAALLAQSSATPWRPVTDERLLHPEPGDWAAYRRTVDVTGFSPLTAIDKSTVAQLRPVWTFSMPDNNRWPMTPIAVNGMLFVSSGTGKVIAFDAATGDVVWIHERRYPKDVGISQASGRARGVAVYGDMIYWGTADSHLLALDARTGKVVWDVTTGDYHTGEGHNHPPLIADGKVFLGQSGGDRTAKGKFRAYDAKTGKLLWTVYTAPRPGDPGYDTWPKGKLPPMGAAPWNTPSYDPQLKLVYFGTGQPTPWTEAMRGPGKALFTNSILAVDSNTGKIRWHFQAVPSDNWDRDSVFENVLVDLPIKGRTRKVLIQTGKTGWGVILDRATGEFLGAFRTAYENFVLGWSKTGQPQLNPELLLKPADIGSTKTFTVCPHIHGARNLNAASFSPITRLYYLGINNTCMDSKVVPVEYEEGHPMSGTEGPARFAPGLDYVGEFVAFDPTTGQRRWTYRPPGGAAMIASAMATAGGIVFGGTVDRQFFALDADTGRLLWQIRLNGDVSGAPVAFEVDGREYIAITAGGRPGPTTSFAAVTKTVLPEGSGMVWVFALPDKRDFLPYPRAGRAAVLSMSETPALPAAAERRPPAATAPAGAGYFTPAQADRGEELFQRTCASCHKVADQTGAAFRGRWGRGTLAALFTYVSHAMPANAPGSLKQADYAAVIAYLLRESGYPPGANELEPDAAALAKVSLAGGD